MVAQSINVIINAVDNVNNVGISCIMLSNCKIAQAQLAFSLENHEKLFKRESLSVGNSFPTQRWTGLHIQTCSTIEKRWLKSRQSYVSRPSFNLISARLVCKWWWKTRSTIENHFISGVVTRETRSNPCYLKSYFYIKSKEKRVDKGLKKEVFFPDPYSVCIVHYLGDESLSIPPPYGNALCQTKLHCI